MIESPVLKYNGGKFRLGNWIRSYFPNHRTYVETCFGGGSVFFGKSRANVEIVNDIDDNVTTFFRILRDDRHELIRLIKYTEYSEKILNQCIGLLTDKETDYSDLEIAWAFYCCCWMSLRANNVENKSVSFRMKGNIENFGGHNPARLFAKLKHLIQASQRLRGVTITSSNILDSIPFFDSRETLFYIDLPYLGKSRNTKKLYNKEMREAVDHRSILELCKKSKGMFVISHYPASLYDDVLEGWERVTTETLSNNMVKGATKEDKIRIEALYLSPNVSEKINGELLPGIKI